MLKNIFNREAGKVFSAKNTRAISRAYRELRSALIDAGIDPDENDDETARTTANREAGGFSVSDLGTLLGNALRGDTATDEYRAPRIVDIYDETVVYQVGWNGAFYEVSYTVTDDGIVTFGTPSLVVRKVQYIVPGAAQLEAQESAPYDTYDLTMNEAAISGDGTARIKLIAPGWGSSGYYAPDVLRRDGPNVFRSGLKMFWDHPTQAEESAKPEGSLDRWAATLIEDAQYDHNGPNGAGLYARVNVHQDYHARLNTRARHMGVSIRAHGRAKSGTAEGRSGPIIEAITVAKSVDFVTTPGAGGAVLIEAQRDARASSEGEPSMNEEQIRAIVEAAVAAAITPLQNANAALRDAADLREAEAIARARLAQIPRLPRVVAERIAPEIARGFTRAENGTLDRAALIEATNTRASAEMTYLAQIGVPGMTGGIAGMGDSAGSGDLQESATNDAAIGTALVETFKSWGLNDNAATIAANGRTR